jgi:CRISPR-associated protein Csx16
MSAQNDGAQVARLVTFLGTGKYSETVYRFGEREAQKTPHVCRALAELLQPSDIAVLATEEAEKAHWERLQDELRSGNFPAPRLAPIPKGGRPEELWQQFETIKAELRGADGPVMLDITHGFRSQPFFAAAVANFVLAVDEKPPRLRVCYAAFEAKDAQTGVAPIWELTEFVTLLDWTRALAMFLRTGHADDAARATERLGRDLKKDWFEGGRQGGAPKLGDFGKALAQFGADLETLRTGDLLIGRDGKKPSTNRLRDAARDAAGDARRHVPPLADILDRVAAMAEPLVGAGADLSGERGRAAVAALAGLYLGLGRYLEAAATVREGWVNLYAPKTALAPGAADFDPQDRKRAEDRANEHDSTFREVTDRRNDFLHAQYRPGAQKASDVVETVRRLVEKLRTADKTARGACFVNLTNHPSAKWDEFQTKAALALAEAIADVAFPAVPPDADEGAVAALAEECVAKVPREASHALVQGEFTLAAELVRRLQSRGIVCVAATSERMVEEAADGSRASMFRFVRFRRYPDPSQASA